MELDLSETEMLETEMLETGNILGRIIPIPVFRALARQNWFDILLDIMRYCNSCNK